MSVVSRMWLPAFLLEVAGKFVMRLCHLVQESIAKRFRFQMGADDADNV